MQCIAFVLNALDLSLSCTGENIATALAPVLHSTNALGKTKTRFASGASTRHGEMNLRAIGTTTSEGTFTAVDRSQP